MLQERRNTLIVFFELYNNRESRERRHCILCKTSENDYKFEYTTICRYSEEEPEIDLKAIYAENERIQIKK